MNKAFTLLLISLSLTVFSSAGYTEDSSYHADALVNGDLKQAEQGLLTILAKEPNDPYALLNLAYVYKKAGDHDKAQQIYDRILELKSNPYADLASGKSEPVKSIARRAIARMDAVK